MCGIGEFTSSGIVSNIPNGVIQCQAREVLD